MATENGMKVCPVCEKEKPVSEFSACRGRDRKGRLYHNDLLTPQCKECCSKKDKEYKQRPEIKERSRIYAYNYRMDNQEKVLRNKRRSTLLKRYGLTLEDYERMVEEQNSACWICEEVPEVLFVDHDHETNEVRALLCNRCNGGLGLLRDSIEVLEKAIAYLKLHQDRMMK